MMVRCEPGHGMQVTAEQDRSHPYREEQTIRRSNQVLALAVTGGSTRPRPRYVLYMLRESQGTPQGDPF